VTTFQSRIDQTKIIVQCIGLSGLLCFIAIAQPLWADTSDSDLNANVSAETFATWFRQVSNWGRWGAEDQLGTLNFITPAVRKSAALEVKEGYSVSLSRSLEVVADIENASPFKLTMTAVGTPVATGGELQHGYGADRFEIEYHGLVHSHIDALSHIFYKGRMYNDHSQERVTPAGSEVLSVINYKNGILTRGVLVDFPRVLGREYLEDTHIIGPADLERWEAVSGIRIEPGDAVIVRTGRWVKRDQEGLWNLMEGTAGLHPSVAFWLHERQVSLIGSDSVADFLPSMVEGSFFPLHELVIAGMGMPILDALDLEAVSETAARLGRSRFMLSLAPLAADGATGSPVNPIATW